MAGWGGSLGGGGWAYIYIYTYTYVYIYIYIYMIKCTQGSRSAKSSKDKLACFTRWPLAVLHHHTAWWACRSRQDGNHDAPRNLRLGLSDNCGLIDPATGPLRKNMLQRSGFRTRKTSVIVVLTKMAKGSIYWVYMAYNPFLDIAIYHQLPRCCDGATSMFECNKPVIFAVLSSEAEFWPSSPIPGWLLVKSHGYSHCWWYPHVTPAELYSVWCMYHNIHG